MKMKIPTLSCAAVAAALVLALPTAAEAQSARHRSTATYGSSADDGLRLGGLLGFEFGAGDTGLALRLDGEMPIAALSPRVLLDGVLSLGFTHFRDDRSDFRITTNLVKLVPALRITLPDVAPQFGLYGDVGMGLYYASQSLRFRPFGSFSDDSTSGVGVAMRFAGGAFYDVNGRLRLGGELGVNPYFGDFSETTVTLMGSVTYRL